MSFAYPWGNISLAKPLTYHQEQNQSCKEAMVEAFATGDYITKDIADHFSVHYSTVSRAIKKADEKVRDCKT